MVKCLLYKNFVQMWLFFEQFDSDNDRINGQIRVNTIHHRCVHIYEYSCTCAHTLMHLACWPSSWINLGIKHALRTYSNLCRRRSGNWISLYTVSEQIIELRVNIFFYSHPQGQRTPTTFCTWIPILTFIYPA